MAAFETKTDAVPSADGGDQRALRLAAVGEICADVYLPEGKTRLGGISANFAHFAALEGADALLFAALGDDHEGRVLSRLLADAPYDASFVVGRHGSSTRQQLRIEAGERRFCGYRGGVAHEYRLKPRDLQALAEVDVIACTDGLPTLMEQCLDVGPPVVVDFSQDTAGNEGRSPAAWIGASADRIAIAFVGGERTHLPELLALSSSMRGLIVLTAGAAGAYAIRAGRQLWQPSLADVVVDTNGAGDAFQGAFTASSVAAALRPAALPPAAPRRAQGCSDDRGLAATAVAATAPPPRPIATIAGIGNLADADLMRALGAGAAAAARAIAKLGAQPPLRAVNPATSRSGA